MNTIPQYIFKASDKPSLPTIQVPLVEATDETVKGYGALVDDPGLFDIDPTGLTALDAGLSTGGFTDCMLQRGATKVYGVDVGYGQVAEKVRVDPRVVARNLPGAGPLMTSNTARPPLMICHSQTHSDTKADQSAIDNW